MGEISSGSDLFNGLAYEFAERFRRGERPSPREYAERYPHLAGEIRELFPMLAMMEQARSGADPERGPIAEAPRRGGPIPDRLGDYRILREIGRGGMGVVYEAVQESLGRHVALKVLGTDLSGGPVALARFRREAGPRRCCTTRTSCRAWAWAITRTCRTTRCNTSGVGASTRCCARSRPCDGGPVARQGRTGCRRGWRPGW